MLCCGGALQVKPSDNYQCCGAVPYDDTLKVCLSDLTLVEKSNGAFTTGHSNPTVTSFDPAEQTGTG